jgi:methionyl-tRNA formyltransferase
VKTIFFGSSDYCLPILEALKKDLILVVTRPDKPEGRKQTVTPSPVNLWAQKNSVPVITPATLKKDTEDRLVTQRRLKELTPDFAVVADYGLIIPEAVFSLPKHGTFNIHFSQLPELRGPSPVQFTLLQGQLRAWVTIFKLENPPELGIKMDAGPILYQNSFPIFLDDTTDSLYTRLFKEAGTVLLPMLQEHLAYGQALTRQDHAKATFCRFLTKDDGFINWETLQKATRGEEIELEELPKIQQEALTISRPPEPITSCPVYHFFQGVTPWPGMWTINPNGKRVKIITCHCDAKKFVPDEIQFEGKKPQPAGKSLSH